jgi:hydroxysqualene dehydroxylase
MRVVVVGGGVAGLAAATRLVDGGHEVTLCERRAQLGGRAYSVTDETTGDVIDNGQHLVMGCYSALRGFLDRIGASGELVFQERLDLAFLDGTRRTRLRAAALPAPFHLVGGLFGFGALGWLDRARLLKLPALVDGARDDETVERWLDRLGQSEPARRVLWRPLARATLNDEPRSASAKMLAAVVREGLLGSREGARLGFPRRGLTQLYVDAARRYVEHAGGRVRASTPVAELVVERAGSSAIVRAVRLAPEAGGDGERVAADAVVLAVPPDAVAPLVPEAARANEPYFDAIARLAPSPIVSAHLWFDEPVATGEAMLGLIDRPFDWIFRHARHVTLVASAARALIERPADEILDAAEADVRRAFGVRAPRRHGRVWKERAATIAHTAGTESLRPKTRTPIGGLFVCGDFVRTGLPATLESAVRAADEACAHLEAWTPPVEKPRGEFIPLGRLTRA